MKNSDDKIKELIKTVEARREALKEMDKVTKEPWKTNCSYSVRSDVTDKKNVATMNEEMVIYMVSNLIARNRDSVAAMELLGLEPKFVIQGYSYQDWVSDAKKRLAVINMNSKKKEFDILEEKLNSLVSPELRRAIELENIEKILNG